MVGKHKRHTFRKIVAETPLQSVDDPAAFWRAVWDFTGVIGEGGIGRVLVDGDRMPGARWFPDVRLNFAENLLADRAGADPVALVFRDETEQTARAVLNRPDLVGTQRIAYVLNLTEPNGMFDARDFMIRDGDTLYVTEAPYVQWYKTIAALTGSLNSANTLATAAGQ